MSTNTHENVINHLIFNRYLEAALEYNLGVNFIYTEETAAGVERLKNVLEVYSSFLS